MMEQVFADQQIGFPILTIVTFFPLLGALVIWALRDEALAWKVGFAVAAVDFLVSIPLFTAFSTDSAALQFVEQYPWIPTIGISYHLGVDGISMLFVVLTTLLGLLIVGYSYGVITERVRGFLMALFALQTTMLGVFVSLDMVLFFVFWELMLIPSYFMIRLWGTEGREYAAVKYVVYTLLGSVLMLVGIVILYLQHWSFASFHGMGPALSFDLLDLMRTRAFMPLDVQIAVFVFLFFGFAFKTPVIPFHTWMPNALYSGPIAMSVILAGVKLGTFGFVRYSIPLAPDAARAALPIMMWLGLIGILYGAYIAIMQADFRKLLAYSSISHLGYVAIGIFALTYQGIQGGLIQMINLGISTAGLFFFAGFLWTRRQTLTIAEFGGLAKTMPLLATFFLIMIFSSIGLPGTNGFIGEFLILLGAFKAHWIYGAIGVLGVILGAAYMLWFYERAIFGPVTNPINERLPDLNRRELAITLPLVALVFWIGVYPSPFLHRINGSVEALHARLQPPGQTPTPLDASANLPDGDLHSPPHPTAPSPARVASSGAP
ncbi:MAG: complex I subunit 4 family protein [Nitrospirota bacterium]